MNLNRPFLLWTLVGIWDGDSKAGGNIYVYSAHDYTIMNVKTAELCQEIYHSDVLMSVMASQITSLSIVYSIVYSILGTDQRKY